MLLNQSFLSKSLLLALFFIAACSPPSPPEPRPDLTSNLSSATGTVTSSSTIEVTGFISNKGEVGVSNSYSVGVYLSTDDAITTSDTLVGYITGPSNLPINGTSTVTGSFSVPTLSGAGTYNLGLIADAQGTVAESNENNNASTTSSVTYVSCDGGTQKNVSVSWAANKEIGVNSTGGGYKVYYSLLSGFAAGDAGVTIVDVPFVSGTTPVSKVLSLSPCIYYVRVAGYSNLGGGTTSDLSTEITVTVP